MNLTDSQKKIFAILFAAGEPLETDRLEVALLNRQKCPKATWGKPQDPDAPERPPGRAMPSRSVG